MTDSNMRGQMDRHDEADGGTVSAFECGCTIMFALGNKQS
jgi:hypothetical protein